MRLLLPCLALLAIALPAAADSFDDAFKTEDADAKRAAVKALADKAAGGDDEAYAKLVKAAGDRQTQEAAVAALRARSGLKPAPGKGGGGYPDYPTSDTPAAWQAWLKARDAEREKEKKIAEALKVAEEAKKGAEAKDKDPAKAGETGEAGGAASADPSAKPAVPAPARPSSDLGRMDRVVFKTGGSLLCFILSKRVDDTGNLISVRVVHRDEGGEEVLSADLVAHIEEDIEQGTPE